MIAILGVIFKVFVINTPNWFTVGLYLGMGWLSVFGYREITHTLMGFALFWLILGGVIFTIGAVIYALEWPNLIPGKFGSHELWHLFVIAGCICHYFLILFYVAPYPRL